METNITKALCYRLVLCFTEHTVHLFVSSIKSLKGSFLSKMRFERQVQWHKMNCTSDTPFLQWLTCWMSNEAYQGFCMDFLRHFEAWLFFRFSKKDETMPLKNNIILTVNNKYNTRKWSLNQIDCFCSQFITVWCS